MGTEPPPRNARNGVTTSSAPADQVDQTTAPASTPAVQQEAPVDETFPKRGLIQKEMTTGTPCRTPARVTHRRGRQERTESTTSTLTDPTVIVLLMTKDDTMDNRTVGFIDDDFNFMEAGTSAANLLRQIPNHGDIPGLTSSLGLSTRQLFDIAGRSGSMRGFGNLDLLNARNVFEPSLGVQLQGLGSEYAGSLVRPSQSSLRSTRDKTEYYQNMMRTDVVKLKEMLIDLSIRTMLPELEGQGAEGANETVGEAKSKEGAECASSNTKTELDEALRELRETTKLLTQLVQKFKEHSNQNVATTKSEVKILRSQLESNDLKWKQSKETDES